MRVRVRGTVGDAFEKVVAEGIRLAALTDYDVEVECNDAVVKVWVGETVEEAVRRLRIALTEWS